MQPQIESATQAYSLELDALRESYRALRLTPTQVVRDVLSRIDSSRDSNPAWIHIASREALLERARDLERRHAADELMPLYGVPFGIKDNIDVAGLPTTAACPAFGYFASHSAHVVELLERAGAICIGKTNMDQFATGLVGTRSPYGACKNPFDARYISGGSSSGSAVAVALGHVSFALGTDTAGSGRVPAGFCNVVGVKPTRGLMSMRGVVPACRSLDCLSIFALTVENAGHVAEIMQEADPSDSFSRAPPTNRLTGSLQRLRCGVPRAANRQFFDDPIAKQAFEHALDTLRSLGAELVEFDYAPFAETARLLYEGPWIAERLAAIEPFFRASADAMHTVVRSIIAAGDKFSAVDAFTGHYALQSLKKRCAAVWEHADVLVVPTAPTIYRVDAVMAEPIELNSNLGYYTNFVNLLDLAAIAVPAGFRADGLPSGITLIARAFEDEMLSHWAARFHRSVGTPLGATGFPLPPAEPHDESTDDSVALAVVGAHLSGMPLNDQLTSRGARFQETSATAPRYRLYALAGTVPPKPGIARAQGSNGVSIAVEVWRMPRVAFGDFVAEVPPPLAIGTVTLADGREVKGFVCEDYALHGARDISQFGGWRDYVKEQSASGRTLERTR